MEKNDGAAFGGSRFVIADVQQIRANLAYRKRC